MFWTFNLRPYRWLAGTIFFVMAGILVWAIWWLGNAGKVAGDVETFTVFCCDQERPLYPAIPPVKGPDVEDLQERLKELGFYDGPVDGIYGQQVVEAVNRWQIAKGLPADGCISAEMWPLLDSIVVGEQFTNAKTSAPHPKAALSILIDLQKHSLSLFADGQLYKTYPVATGRAKTPSPVGEWKIADKQKGWGGGFGSRWFGLNVPWGIYGIHGTNKPWSVGKTQSHGCFRMHKKDVEELYSWVPLGTTVKVINSALVSLHKRQYRRGEMGQDIVYLQYRLQEMGYLQGLADGRFGPSTEEAVRALQKEHGFDENGILDEQVLKTMGFDGG
ncbi:MAG: peptidoglycan-binding protein [Heliobacteriaceae bacterium]|nr:peptidoglycan-binding protein [Heliobacteriaceae bacterium]